MVIMVPRIAFEIVEIGTSVLAKRRQDGMSALAVFAAEPITLGTIKVCAMLGAAMK